MPKKETKVVKKTTTKSKKAVNAAIYDQNGTYIRTYNEVDQGADFLILAEQFANKRGYTVKYE
jgi:hypothetical protein